MTMKIIPLVLAFVLIASPVHGADKWTDGDIAREVVFQAMHVIDYHQTMNVVNHPDKYRELNPVIGEHPSRDRLNAFMFTGAVLHIGVTHFLPAKWRPYWQYLTIGIKAGCIVQNLNTGLRIDF